MAPMMLSGSTLMPEVANSLSERITFPAVSVTISITPASRRVTESRMPVRATRLSLR